MVWTKRGLMKQRCCPRRRNSMKVDKNDIYGTYARGEGGEGDSIHPLRFVKNEMSGGGKL